MVSKEISRFISTNFKKNNYVLTGRATTGLYLILQALEVKEKEVICPANICYSIINAITITNNKPAFVDVDPHDGNIRTKYIKEAICRNTAGVLVPHMFGNPCIDIKAIRDLCVKEKILLIEDCAVSIGAEFEGLQPGQFGDYSLFSFGHNKTVDIGVGGLVASNNSLKKIEKLNSQLPGFNERINDKIKLYSTLYRDIYHSDYYEQLLCRFSVFNDFFEDMYLFKVNSRISGRLLKQLNSLEKQLIQRKKNAVFFDKNINFGGRIKKYPCQAGAVYWRYNILINHALLRKRIINKLLENNILVSAWYPPVNRLFGDENIYKNAERFSKKIINLPVTVSPKEAKKIAQLVNNA